MTKQTKTLTMLNRNEAQVIQGFISQMDFWQGQHGEKADTIEIVYYPEDDGFEVVNNEENNGILRRNRTTTFRAEILAWATNQLNQLRGWDNDKTVTAFTCVCKNSEYGVLVEVVPTASLADKNETVAEEAGA